MTFVQRVRDFPRKAWGALLAQPGRWPRLAITAACVLVVTIYCGNSDMGGDPDSPRGDGKYRPVLGRGDGHMLYLMARSTALDGDWVFDNDLGRFGDPWIQPISPTGRKTIPHPIGPALIWTPLIWIAQAGAVVVNAFGADIPLHGYTLWHQRFVFLSSALGGCFLALLAMRLARRFVGGSWSPTYAAVAILLGTPLTYYVTVMPGYGHALDAVACGGFLAYWTTTIGRRDLKRYVVLGVLLGVAMLIRMQELALGVVVAIEAAAAVVATVRRMSPPRDVIRAMTGGAIVLAIAAVVFVPQLVYWKLVYGDFFAVPQGTKYTRFGSPMILETLFSPRNGWFSTTPLAYLGTIGLVCVPKPARFVAGALAIAVAIQVYLDSTIMDYWGMAAFGQRRLCNVTIVLVIGLAALLWRLGAIASRTRLPRGAVHAIAVVIFGCFCVWNLNRVLQLHAGKAAPSEPIATCCNRVPAPFKGMFQSVFDVIGNPFEFPANAIFALRHAVPIQRWDQVGNYPLVPPAGTLVDDSLWNQKGTWNLGGAGGEAYLIHGWSRTQPGPKPFRWTVESTARAIVPNLMPERQRIRVWLMPGGSSDIVVRWDGATVATQRLGPGWQTVEFTVDMLTAGDHEIELEAAVAPSTFTVPTGVGLSTIELQLMKPIASD